MKNFYERLYRKRLDNLISVENFLGNETLNTQWVGNRRLSDMEKESLEGVVSMAELQKAFDESNFNSSSGWDGMSYRVIGKFWEALRFPMLKMVNETFRDGELMETFKLGIIKVIPKKGNAERLGDWRPITLLCCGYKIISGIVANRLEQYLMKIMGRAQKGFLKQKQIHTCAANLITCIAQSWDAREECGIMCVDLKKAFDSIEHDAIKTILRFFNFGEFMVKMVSTLLNKRTARIILDEGYSETFSIERGTPQGDRSSPYIFIICMEVLLMKILSMEGGGIDSCDFIKRKLMGLNIETMTAEAYADDLTIIFKMSERGVECIIKMLNDFATVTGLEINKEKTQLMVTGSDEWMVGQRICDIIIVGEITLLGIKIDRKLLKLDDNWASVITKMRRLSGYWSNFGLSISGRVMVAKTYLISQAIYVMGILPLKAQTGITMNEIIVDFVSGRDRPIERRRQLLCASIDGYGVTDMNDMNVYIKSIWIRRIKEMITCLDYIAVIVIDDRRVLNGDIEFDYERICTEYNGGDKGIIVQDIGVNWKMFKRKFYEVGGNFMIAKIFGNNAILENGVNLEVEVFGEQRFGIIRERVMELKMLDLIDNRYMFKDRVELEANWNIPITWAEYFRLRGGVRSLLQIRGDRDPVEGKSINEFMDRGKLRCSKLRKTAEGKISKKYIEHDPKLIPSVNSLWGVRVMEMDRVLVEWNLTVWTITVLAPKFKDFCFRLMHGRLYLNSALSHFSDTRPGCTFCTIRVMRELKNDNIAEGTLEYNRRLGQVENETIHHLFWGCRESQRVIGEVVNEIAGTENMRVNKDRYFEGTLLHRRCDSIVAIIVSRIIQFGLYKCRNRRRIPLKPHILEEIEGLKSAMGNSARWREGINNLDELCRTMLEGV